jgi:hypothetical protein
LLEREPFVIDVKRTSSSRGDELTHSSFRNRDDCPADAKRLGVESKGLVLFREGKIKKNPAK